MSDKALFDAVRAIAGRGLTQAEVNQIKAAIPAPSLAAIGEIDPNDMALIRELERDEGRVLHAYQDSRGFWTIGIGRLIDKRKGGGISNEEADLLKRNDIARFKRDLDRVAPWWRTSGRNPDAENFAVSATQAPAVTAGAHRPMSALPWNNGMEQ